MSYYVRSRGKVAGPFEMDALQQLAKRGKLTRFDQISGDEKASWRPAGELAELFAPAARRAVATAAVGGGGGGNEFAADDGTIELKDNGTPRGGVAARTAGAATSFFYAQNGAAVGPMSLEVLQTLATNGTLRGDDAVWADGSDIATPARQVPMLASFYSGRPNPLGYAGAPSGSRDAGFWLRVVAAVIDAIVMALASTAVALVLGFLLSVLLHAADARSDTAGLLGMVLVITVPVVMRWLYHTMMESSQAQATLGKSLLGLKVSDESASRITFGRANGRYFSKILSELTFGIGYVLAAFTPRKQALHDMICTTYVVQK